MYLKAVKAFFWLERMAQSIPYVSLSPMSEISKAYNPKTVEAHWSKQWIEQQSFKATVDQKKDPYAIMIPPPNVTGMLHMGHVLDNTLQDIFIRRARLEGKSVSVSYTHLTLPTTPYV